jgi:hypothetical protein
LCFFNDSDVRFPSPIKYNRLNTTVSSLHIKQVSLITETEDHHNWPQSTHKITTDYHIRCCSSAWWYPRTMKDMWSQLHPIQKFNSVLFALITQIAPNQSRSIHFWQMDMNFEFSHITKISTLDQLKNIHKQLAET